MSGTIARHASTAEQPLERALTVFVQGFSLTRSFTHPYVPERIEGLWALRDAERRSGPYRTEEWFAHALPPAEVDRVVRARARGRFAICAALPAGESDEALRSGYRAMGYRLNGTEPIMVHALRRIPRCRAEAAVVRVTTQEMADRLKRAARSRQILPQHLAAGDAAPLRQYVALKQDQIVGWVRSIVAGDATWCSNMFVMPRHRRQGIASLMLSRMLRDDRAAGATLAVLAASHTGAKLYTTLGYREIATLYVWTPAKR